MSEEYKRFGELTREEQLVLVNHVLDGGDAEVSSGMGIWSKTEMTKLGCLCFYNSHPYRKSKTEIEILKEECEMLREEIRNLRGTDHGIKVGDTVTHSGKNYIVEDSGLKNFPFRVGDICYTSLSLIEDFTPVYK